MVNSKNYDKYCSQIDNVVRKMEEDVIKFLNEHNKPFIPNGTIYINNELKVRQVFTKSNTIVYVEYNCGETKRFTDCAIDEMLEIYYEMTQY